MTALPVGTYKVVIGPMLTKGFQPVDKVRYVGPAPKFPPSPIPKRYAGIATSGLTATVKQGDNPPFKFDLPKQ